MAASRYFRATDSSERPIAFFDAVALMLVASVEPLAALLRRGCDDWPTVGRRAPRLPAKRHRPGDRRSQNLGAAVYETDPTRPTGSVKTAWESARERTRAHCATCKDGRLTNAQSDGGYVCSACGWKTAELPLALTKLRFHDLRHTGASRLIAARVPLPIVGKLLGWSAGTLAKMSARYGHFSMEELRSAVESISRVAEEISSGYPKKSPKSDAVTAGRLQ